MRQCARIVGLRDHMALWRTAHRYGLGEMHADRRAYREAARKTVKALQLASSRRRTPMSTLKAAAESLDALELIERHPGC